ncbi:hypothetical protein OUZ56_000409 [Daphnia magna]|uniref:Uncharacterized protein n=1 Tax=Daphnia magna TaxID=35525 RepID=A0ABQ9ZZL5_9CRUS|nr:hypothetical protein OUZ56_000409 [Daphnia magna]
MSLSADFDKSGKVYELNASEHWELLSLFLLILTLFASVVCQHRKIFNHEFWYFKYMRAQIVVT